MPEAIIIGEIEALRLDVGWEFPVFPEFGQTATIQLPAGRACIGPDPGYHIASAGPVKYGNHDRDGDPRELGALRFAENREGLPCFLWHHHSPSRNVAPPAPILKH